MEKLLKELKTMFLADKFVVTGSVALAKYKLMPIDKIGDVDIILVNPAKESIDLANRMATDFPAKGRPSQTGSLIACFMKDGKKVELFGIFGSKEKESIIIDGIDYDTIPSIVSAKKKYNRVKDWMQLRKMGRMFFKEEEFTTFLNNQ